MDMSTSSEQNTGKRATTPKHGKKPENRLYSKYRRGPTVKSDETGGAINPDASIEVAAVCGNLVLFFDKSRNGVREPRHTMSFRNHGDAVVYAAEYDEGKRRSRSSRDTERVYAPFYLVKAGGVVIDQTNTRERAHADMHGATKPTELWRINEGGSAELLDRVTY